MLLDGVGIDRLDKVISRLKCLNIRFPGKEIYKRMGEDKGNISNYLAGKKPMSDNFYTTFLEKFPIEGEKIVKEKKEIVEDIITIRQLVINNTTLTDTNKDLVAEVIDGAKSMRSFVSDQNKLIEKVLSIGTGKAENANYPSKQHSVSYLSLHLHLIADVLSHKFALDRENILLILGSTLSEIHLEKKIPDTHSALGK
jgi:hypothetical protein